jgi:hypothetical protein
MKKKCHELLDNEPWYINNPSPFSKWLMTLSLIGFCWFGKTGGVLWFLVFNPAAVMLYVVAVIIAIVSLMAKI